MMISHEKSFARKGVHDEIASNVSHEKYHCLLFKFSPVLSYETYQAIWSWTPFRPKLFSDEILTFVAYDMIVSYDTCCVKTFYHQLLTCSCLNYFKISIRALFVVPQNYKKNCFFSCETLQAISSWTPFRLFRSCKTHHEQTLRALIVHIGIGFLVRRKLGPWDSVKDREYLGNCWRPIPAEISNSTEPISMKLYKCVAERTPSCALRYRVSHSAKTWSVGLSHCSWIFRELLTTHSANISNTHIEPIIMKLFRREAKIRNFM